MATQLRIQVSSAWARTWLCTNSSERSASRPAAKSSVARRRVAAVSSAGSHGIVIACRSTTQKMASWSRAASEPGGGLGVDPAADGAEVVAEVHLAGRFDARKDPCHGRPRYRPAAARPGRFALVAALYHMPVIRRG